MIQEIVTYIIIAAALVIAGVYFYRTFSSKRNNSCAGCPGCALKNKIKENADKGSLHKKGSKDCNSSL